MVNTQEKVREFLDRHNLSQAEFARTIGVPRETVTGWANYPLKKPKAIQALIQKCPWLFDSAVRHPFSADQGEQTQASEPVIVRSEQRGANEVIQFQVKAILMENAIAQIVPLLQWFIFAATPEQRDALRTSLGSSWQHFLELTRAMNGELARQLAFKEGRLNDDNNHAS